MEKMFVAPAREGLIVRDPITLELLAAGGAWVPCDTYWMRALGCGDVVEKTPTIPLEDA